VVRRSACRSIYRYGWFVGFALAFVLYLLLRKVAHERSSG
jgi:cytosine/uracil/thiamine/allantoin permease